MSNSVVVMDEAGHTGENLLDADQPVYALAAIRLDEATAGAAVTSALRRAQRTTTELNFGSLRRSNIGRKNILSLLNEVKLTTADGAIIVLHKPWMVAAKLVDELIEPRMLARGLQVAWYASAQPRTWPTLSTNWLRKRWGEMYHELTSSFVTLVRDARPSVVPRSRGPCNGASSSVGVSRCMTLLSVMIDTLEQMNAEFGARDDVLDPALPSLLWQGGYWSSTLQTPFEVLHDDSTSVQRWQESIFGGIQRNMADRAAPHSFAIGEVTIHLPTRVKNIARSPPPGVRWEYMRCQRSYPGA